MQFTPLKRMRPRALGWFVDGACRADALAALPVPMFQAPGPRGGKPDRWLGAGQMHNRRSPMWRNWEAQFYKLLHGTLPYVPVSLSQWVLQRTKPLKAHYTEYAFRRRGV